MSLAESFGNPKNRMNLVNAVGTYRQAVWETLEVSNFCRDDCLLSGLVFSKWVQTQAAKLPEHQRATRRFEEDFGDEILQSFVWIFTAVVTYRVVVSALKLN
jgi:hypothetical protein